MGKALDLVGQRFGKLVVISLGETVRKNSRTSIRMWVCVCDCSPDIKRSYSTNDLRSGNVQSCSCYKREWEKEKLKRYNKYDLSSEYGIGYTKKGYKFYFDLEDYDKISYHCWYVGGGGRLNARNSENKTPLKFHRIILELNDPNIIVDHINRNQLDNRKSNLRICSIAENSRNTSKSKNNTSGFIGVHFRKGTLRYSAGIEYNRKQISLGCFEDITDAVIARLTAEKMYFGEFAPQRHLFETYNI